MTTIRQNSMTPQVMVASGADLAFATPYAARSKSERQIQSSTRINILLVVFDSNIREIVR
jgi:hypothetical protein